MTDKRVTYQQVKNEYRRRYDRTAKDCWIAEILRDHDKTGWRRTGAEPKVKCPQHVKPKLKKLMKEMGMI